MAKKIAVYWDFENIHASIATIKNGPNWYKDNRFTKQPIFVDIKSIMEFARGAGDINVNKAYGNWQSFHAYSFDLQDSSIDLIQLYPRGSHGKNGADIRMALDIFEDILLNQHIDTIILIGGDSDYISVAQKVRQKGKSIIGIGVKETTNQYWVKACNEFKYYSSLLIKSDTIKSVEEEGYEEFDIKEAKVLLCKAIEKISSISPDGLTKKAAIKPMIMRLDPSFDESNYGYKTFNEFLDDCSDIIEFQKGEFDHLASIKSTKCSVDNGSSGYQIISNPYERLLRKQQVRMLDGKLLKYGIYKSYELFEKYKIFATYKLFQEKLLAEIIKKYPSVTETDISKIKAILYKSFSFHLDPDTSSIVLCSGVSSPETLYDKVITMLTKRILDNVDGEPNIKDFCEIIFGDNAKESIAREYIDKYYKTAKQSH